MADDDNRDYFPRRAVEEVPAAKEVGRSTFPGVAAVRSRVGRIALPSVLVLAVSAGLAFSVGATSPAGSDSVTAAPAAPVLDVERSAEALSRSALRAPVIDPAATAEHEVLPAKDLKQSGEASAEPQVLNGAAFAPHPKPAPVAKAAGHQYAAAPLNVRAAANADSERVGSFDRGERVGITGSTDNGFNQVEFDGRNGWVSSQYLSESKPAAPSGGSQASANTQAASAGGAACKTALPGLTSRTAAVHQALCANFPAISSFGGVRPDWDDEHPSGRAIDAMVSGTSTGDAVANWARANAAQYGITEVIWNQRIWTTQRASEGWRGMGDRGSVTANHGDHVHISVS